jgi:hypothetical protein
MNKVLKLDHCQALHLAWPTEATNKPVRQEMECYIDVMPQHMCENTDTDAYNTVAVTLA